MKQVKLRMRVPRQNDGHGCVYCAMASVYRYYGLDPLRVRLRLGTDNHALPWYAPCLGAAQAFLDRLGIDTRGTLCPDVYAALHADGFDIACANRN